MKRLNLGMHTAVDLINVVAISTVKPMNAIVIGTQDAGVSVSPLAAINEQHYEFSVIIFGIIFFSV
jgi:hypothetical protein